MVYHVTYRDWWTYPKDKGGRVSEEDNTIVLINLHPLIWAARALEESKGKLWTEILRWQESPDPDGLIASAVRSQGGFSYEEDETVEMEEN